MVHIDDDCPTMSGLDSNSHDIPETSYVNMSGEDSLEACLGIKGQIEPVANSCSHDHSFDRELDKMVAASLTTVASDTLPLNLLLDDSSSMMENYSHTFSSADKNQIRSKPFRTSFDNVLNQTASDLFRQSPTDGILSKGDSDWINFEKERNVTAGISDWPHQFVQPKNVCKRIARTKSVVVHEKISLSPTNLATKVPSIAEKQTKYKNRLKKSNKVKSKKSNVKNIKRLETSTNKRRQKVTVSSNVEVKNFERRLSSSQLSIIKCENLSGAKVKDEDSQNMDVLKTWNNSNDDDTHVFGNCDIKDDNDHMLTTDDFPVIAESFSLVNTEDKLSSCVDEDILTDNFETSPDFDTSILDAHNLDPDEMAHVDSQEEPSLHQISTTVQDLKHVTAKQRIVLPKPSHPTTNLVLFQLHPVQTMQNIGFIKFPSNQCISTIPQKMALPPLAKSNGKELLTKKIALPKTVENSEGLSDIQLRHPTIVRLLSTPCKIQPQPADSFKNVSNNSPKRMHLKPRKIVLRVNVPEKVVMMPKASDTKEKPLVLQRDKTASSNGKLGKHPQTLENAFAKPLLVIQPNLKNKADDSEYVAIDNVVDKNYEFNRKVPKVVLLKKHDTSDLSNTKRKPNTLICKKRSGLNKTTQNGFKTEMAKSMLVSEDTGNGETLADVYMRNWKPTGQFQCNICNYSSVTVNFLFRHWLVCHNGLLPYRCRYCEFQAGSRYIVTRHQSYNHRDSEKCVIVVREILDRVCQEFEQAFGSTIKLQNDCSGGDTMTSVSYQCSLCSVVDIRARIICHCMLHFDLRAFSCAVCEFCGEDAECVRFHYLEVHPDNEPRVIVDLDAVKSMEKATGLTLSNPISELMQAYGLEVDLDSVALSRNGTLCILKFVDCT